MPPVAQNLAVFLIVAICVAYITWQAIQAVRGRKSKLGSCCAKGCGASAQPNDAAPKSAPAQFLPLANVGRPEVKSVK